MGRLFADNNWVSNLNVDDNVMLAQTFFDQDLVPLKKMEALEVGELGGRMMALRMRMYEIEKADSYTELTWDEADFDIDLDDQLFTLFSLRQGAKR